MLVLVVRGGDDGGRWAGQPLTPDEIADVLERAADALWMYGRAKGAGLREDGSMCVRGAINHALGLDPDVVMGVKNDADTALASYLAKHPDAVVTEYVGLDSYWREIVAEGRFPTWVWNDHTDDDALVIDTLKHCAKDLRAVTA